MTALVAIVGGLFFLAGTVGLLRFPDVYTRLHALTKADNVGLGLVVLALIFRTDSWAVRLKLVLTWLLVLMAAAVMAHLIARTAMRRGVRPWRAP
jgi:multicomponent Na+:H+ antiporter subunit G